MPAQRLKRRETRFVKIKSKKFGFKKYMVFIGISLFLLTTTFLIIRPHIWNRSERLVIAIARDNGEAAVVFVDPLVSSITTIVIPADTLVNVGRQLGEWKIKSVWQLGQNEKVGGKLLAETVTKTFRIPAEAWGNEKIANFISGKPLDILKAFTLSGQTNLTLRDKIFLSLFSLRLKMADKIFIKMEETGVLEKTKLPDGQEGYVVRTILSPQLVGIFSDSQVSKEGKLIQIIDKTGEFSVAQKVGQIIETLGAKVVFLSKKEESEGDCIARGNNSVTLKKIAKIFSCQVVSKGDSSDLDIEVEIGKSFAKRF